MSEGEAPQGVRRVRLLTTVQDYLIRFSKPAAECPKPLEEGETVGAVAQPRFASFFLCFAVIPSFPFFHVSVFHFVHILSLSSESSDFSVESTL